MLTCIHDNPLPNCLDGVFSTPMTPYLTMSIGSVLRALSACNDPLPYAGSIVMSVPSDPIPVKSKLAQ